MQSTAKDVTAYLQEVPENRRACLTKSRDSQVKSAGMLSYLGIKLAISDVDLQRVAIRHITNRAD